MTDKEKAVVMAHTGICMLTGEKFSIYHKYIEELMGRPVFTHELANAETVNQIKEKSKEDFLKLCKDEFVSEPCDDCISRQSAIDTIFAEPLYKPGMKKRYAEEVVPAIFEKNKIVAIRYTTAKNRSLEENDFGL